MGNFNYVDDDTCISVNRDRFIKSFSIKSASNASGRPYNIDFDHTELYLTHDKKYVYVSSPYMYMAPEVFLERYKFMSITSKIYAKDAYTYIAVFDSLAEMRKASLEVNEM